MIHSSFILANRFHAREILQNVQVIGVLVFIFLFSVLGLALFWLELVFSVSMPGSLPED